MDEEVDLVTEKIVEVRGIGDGELGEEGEEGSWRGREVSLGRKMTGEGGEGTVGWWRCWTAAVAEQGRRRRLKGGGGGARSVAAAGTTAVVSAWPGQGVAAARRRAAAAAATAVGLLPRPSVRSHSRWRRLPSFFSQMMARVCEGVPSPLIEPIMGREGKGPT